MEPPKTQESGAIHWGIVLQNQLSSKVPESSVQDLLKTLPIKTWVFQEEIGEELGGLHYQMYCEFHTKVRKTAILTMFEQIFAREAVSAQKVRKVEAIKRYCTKCETRVSGPWSNDTKLIPWEPEDEFDTLTPYPWQQNIIDIVKSKPNKRTIHWVWEKDGNRGKSTLCRHLAIKHKALVLTTCQPSDMYYAISQYEPRLAPVIVIIDLARSQSMTSGAYTGLECIKNGMFFSSKYESQMYIFNTPHVIIFANYEPTPDMMSKDRYQIINI